MSFWPFGVNLKEALDLLPEPILIVGNKSTDGDSAGCIVALMDYLREDAREVYTYLPVAPSSNLGWMFGAEDFTETILDDYASLVVVDDYIDGDRLGIPIKNDVPIINIDHHMSNKPQGATTDSLFVGIEGNVLTFWAMVPATAAVLIASEIYHPYLWISLYTDTVGFTANGMSGIRWAFRLSEGLEDKGEPLSNELQEQMHERITGIGSLGSFDKFMNSIIYTFSGTYQGEPIQIAIGLIDDEDKEVAMRFLGTLRQYSHITAVTNKINGSTSLRSRKYDFNVLDVAQKFGGGGHIRAAGCTLDMTRPLEEFDKLRDLLLAGVENVRTRIYV